MSHITNHLPRHMKQAGYTLVELLLYVTIVSVLLVSVTMFYGVTLNSRVKNQSIAEVDSQGTLAMEHISQAIRDASTITAPAAAAVGTSLTLTVPTGALSPTIFNLSGTQFGYATDGATISTGSLNTIKATRFNAITSGTARVLYARIGSVAASPNNMGQMAIYSGAASPTTLLASSNSTPLTANAWNGFEISPVAITSGQTYWLAYNTNGDNNPLNHVGVAGQHQLIAQTYGTWPNSWSSAAQAVEYSMFTMLDTGSGANALQIKEGAGAAVPLTNDKVRVTGFTVKNLSRPSTPGVIQVSFTLSRVNNSNRNEYDYQKTFTTSVSLRWP